MRRIVYFDHFGDEFEDGDQLWGHKHHSDTVAIERAKSVLDEIIEGNPCALTERQLAVLRMLLEGYSYRNIGEHFDVSQQAARRYFGRARIKILKYFVSNPSLSRKYGLFGDE
jgi:DNA-directed RNA polymerase specialized sigma24 family protein